MLVHKIWGKQLCGRTTLVWRKWWRKRAVAQVMAQVVAQVWRKLVWRRFGASWLGGRRFGASFGSYLRVTCAKLAPNQLPPNLRHETNLRQTNLRQTCATTCAITCATARVRHHLRQTRVVHPQSCLPQILCTNMLPPPPTCATTCAKPHLRQTRVVLPQSELLCTPDVVHQHFSVLPTCATAHL